MFFHGTFGLLFILFIYFFITVFVLTMLWRIAKALEVIARHLLEIAEDVKQLSERSADKSK